MHPADHRGGHVRGEKPAGPTGAPGTLRPSTAPPTTRPDVRAIPRRPAGPVMTPAPTATRPARPPSTLSDRAPAASSTRAPVAGQAWPAGAEQPAEKKRRRWLVLLLLALAILMPLLAILVLIATPLGRALLPEPEAPVEAVLPPEQSAEPTIPPDPVIVPPAGGGASADSDPDLYVDLPTPGQPAEVYPWDVPGPDIDCSQIGGKVPVAPPDYHHLDSDADGWGCESYG